MIRSGSNICVGWMGSFALTLAGHPAMPPGALRMFHIGENLVGLHPIAQITLIVLGTLVSEDLTCISVGTLIHDHKISWLVGGASCFLGIYIGDLTFFFLGRLAGARAPEISLFLPHPRGTAASRLRLVVRSKAMGGHHGLPISTWHPGAALRFGRGADQADEDVLRLDLFLRFRMDADPDWPGGTAGQRLHRAGAVCVWERVVDDPDHSRRDLPGRSRNHPSEHCRGKKEACGICCVSKAQELKPPEDRKTDLHKLCGSHQKLDSPGSKVKMAA